jgi:hypothetical protein
MIEQQHIEKSADTAQDSGGAVSLIIDYSNGVQKSFAGIPWKRDMAVLDLLQAASSASPGLKFEFVKSFVDRGGREVGSVVSIDEVKADTRDQKWLVWVNSKFIGTELRRVTADSVTKFGEPRIELGDFVVFKLAEGP